MAYAELIMEEIKTLPANRMAQVLDFVGYIKQQETRNTGIGVKDCPLCEKYRDPVTGELRYNAETMAGMQEVEDMIEGKIPAKWYNSLDEMLEDLDA